MKRLTFLSPPRLCNMFHIVFFFWFWTSPKHKTCYFMQHLCKTSIWFLKKNWFEKFLILLLMCFYGHFKVVTVLSVRHCMKISWETRKNYSIRSRYNFRLSWKSYSSIIIIDCVRKWIEQTINKCSKNLQLFPPTIFHLDL